MMRILRKGVFFALVGFFCLAFFRSAFSQEMTAEELVTGISQKWSNIQDFQSDITVGMQMFGKAMKIKGTIWQKGGLFRTEMNLPPELMPRTDKQAEPVKVLMVFDGKVMWQMMPMMNMVLKTDISALDDKIKNAPFSRSLYSLPAVSYSLGEKKRNGNDYYFLETKDIARFIQNSPMSSAGVNLPMNMPFQNIGIWVNKGTLFPDMIEFCDQNNVPVMSLEFKNIKTDQGLVSDLFTFQVPEGMQVMDMTASMKAMAGKMTQSGTVSDTPQSATVPDTTTTQAPQ